MLYYTHFICSQNRYTQNQCIPHASTRSNFSPIIINSVTKSNDLLIEFEICLISSTQYLSLCFKEFTKTH